MGPYMQLDRKSCIDRFYVAVCKRASENICEDAPDIRRKHPSAKGRYNRLTQCKTPYYQLTQECNQNLTKMTKNSINLPSTLFTYKILEKNQDIVTAICYNFFD